MRNELVNRILSRYPTTNLLRMLVVESLGKKYVRELPSDPVEPVVLAERIIDLVYSIEKEYDILQKLDEKDKYLVETENSHKISPRLLGSKYAFFAEACSQLSHTHSFRATFVGPVFLLPDWMVKRRNIHKHTPNFSVAVRRFFDTMDDVQALSVRIILRNSPRFLGDYGRFIEKHERKKFIDDMLVEVSKVWGENANRGPQVCCVDTGYLYLPHIFDHAFLVATRKAANAPVNGGWVDNSLEIIQREKDRFDLVFEGTDQSQTNAISILKKYISNFWRGNI